MPSCQLKRLVLKLDHYTSCVASHHDFYPTEPVITLAAASYSIREPIDDGVEIAVTVVVRRRGDLSEPAQVRLSTRDRSAVAGVDYTAKSVPIDFLPGECLI